jgi:ComF family protein
MSLIDRIIGAVVPHDCLGCGVEGGLLCSGCADKLPGVPPLATLNGDLRLIQAVTPYKGLAKDLLWKLKSGGAQAAATVMARQMRRLLETDRNLLVMPVPTATSRVRQRGYDQAKLLARELAKQARLPYADCLARLGQSHQVGANREQRRQQLGEAFWVRHHGLVRRARILLIDDVTTTGATLEAAAKALKAAGASDIQAIVFAQA